MTDGINDVTVIACGNIAEEDIPLLVRGLLDNVVVFLPSIRCDVDIKCLADEIYFCTGNYRAGVVMDFECDLTNCCGGHLGREVDRSGCAVV